MLTNTRVSPQAATVMIIPVTFDSAGSSTASKLPPALAKISHDEVVLIEMQGAIEVETATPQEKNGKLVGRLQLDEATVRHYILFSFPSISNVCGRINPR